MAEQSSFFDQAHEFVAPESQPSVDQAPSVPDHKFRDPYADVDRRRRAIVEGRDGEDLGAQQKGDPTDMTPPFSVDTTLAEVRKQLPGMNTRQSTLQDRVIEHNRQSLREGRP